jgi:AraC family transcriptional regulator
MNPVNNALWYIESHFTSDITLDDIANVTGVSRFYLTRAFAIATGHSMMRYVRGRRLTEAARALAEGAPDILTVAVDTGYGSHEAFTRAFRDRFGVTPETVRAERRLDTINLQEPIRMDQTVLDTLAPPRIVVGKSLLIAGLSERYTCETSAGIPAQWQRFMPHFGHLPGQIGRVAYGVRYNSDDDGNFDYLCGVEVPNFSRLGPSLSKVRIPAQRYAVFLHDDHISMIRRTHSTIWSTWLPHSSYEVVDAPDFERYGENFDGERGLGGIEIWIPIQVNATRELES